MKYQWTEDVRLPDSRIIQVQRTEEFEGTFYDGTSSHPFWTRETIEIPPSTASGRPVIWQSIWVSKDPKYNDTPQGPVAVALYFDGSEPRIVAEGGIVVDGRYGCIYTDHHGLWSQDKNGNWILDPKSRIHTKYVGMPNLIYGSDGDTLKKFLPALSGHIGVDEGKPRAWVALVGIDTLHEFPDCALGKRDRKYSYEYATTE